MNLLCVGCNYDKTSVEVREQIAFEGEKLTLALTELSTLHECEAVILSTCNRVEIYLAQTTGDRLLEKDDVIEFIAEQHQIPAETFSQQFYCHQQGDAIRHLFRVASSLDSLVIGEAQISGQVKRAYELALEQATTGPLLNTLFQQARQVAKRVRSETGIAQGHASVSSAAVEYLEQVFDHFHDKTFLVIGAGKMGELTLRHLRRLEPKRILVTNRSPEKAIEVAQGCEGEAIPWEGLDRALSKVDVVLSTTGAPEPIVTRDRYAQSLKNRTSGAIVIFDIAVPRDFDADIHDGETTFLYNVDDLQRICQATLEDRRKHIEPAEEIVEEETKQTLKDFGRRRNVPVIARLNQEVEAMRQEIVEGILSRLNGKLTQEDRDYIEQGFRLFQKRVLHGPVAALNDEVHEEAHSSNRHTLLDAIRKLFRLAE